MRYDQAQFILGVVEQETIFITGGTGFLGREIVGRILVEQPQARLALLVRPKLSESPALRTKQLLCEIFGRDGYPRGHSEESLLNRVQVVPGELSHPQFGMGDAEFAALARNITSIYHCAATTSLNEDLEVAREINVGGTIQVLALANSALNQGHAVHLNHVSTAYVAGQKQGIVLPEELTFSQGFRNGYEQSKAEAEALVRDASTKIQTTIFRPSIIVGDSVCGATSAFNVIYVPAKLLVRGLFRFFPAYPNIPFDVVPVDYVADAILSLSRSGPVSRGSKISGVQLPSGTCFHLTVGLGRETNPWELLQCLFDTYNKYRRAGLTLVSVPPLVHPELLAIAYQGFTAARTGFHVLERIVSTKLNVFRQTVPFIPYMISNPRFDSSESIDLLGNEIHPPVFLEYAEHIFRYCFDTNFGRLPWMNPTNLPSWYIRRNLGLNQPEI